MLKNLERGYAAESGKVIPQQAAWKVLDRDAGEANGDESNFEHLTVEKDKEMDAAFVFYSRDMDGDRDKVWPSQKATQRDQMQSSPKTMKALLGGDRYHWYSRFTSPLSQEFLPLFQLKPVGGKAPTYHPFRFDRSWKRQLEMRWWAKDGNKLMFVADSKDCKGKWKEMNVSQRWAKGFLRLSVTFRTRTYGS